jgi:hypothetical protein
MVIHDSTSVLHQIIPAVIPSQKCPVTMGLILNNYSFVGRKFRSFFVITSEVDTVPFIIGF